jgi:hypothetical protein
MFAFSPQQRHHKCAIYRGPGGAGDATADATNAASVAEDFADASAASASAASGSAATASAAATAAGAAQTAAEAAQLAAETAETNAETAETNAETAQTAAEAAQTAAEAAQTAAETAETNAETAETGALAAQTAAEAAQTAAELAETNAETAETNAVAAQTAAEAARDSALAAYDNFDDRYLGAKTADPTLDNDGDALVAGALYFNTVAGAMRVYTGSVWVDAYSSGTTFLAKVNNLSDLPNVATARQNLDLEIGVDVQAFDATILKSADIGVTVQGYDADTAKYDDATANFTGTLQNGGSNVLVDSDIGSTVQAYDATIVVDADIGVTVQAYDSNLTSFVSTFTLPTTDGTSGQVIQTDGSGTLSFATPSSTSDKIEEGNSKVEVVDTGTGHILFQVDGAEVARFNPDQLVTKAGTASLPALTTTGDVNTGIFFPAADTIAFAEGGAEAMRINSSGNVGIGTTSPANWLDISANTSATVGHISLNTTSGSQAIRQFFRESGTSVAQVAWSVDGNALELIAQKASSQMLFYTANAERARIDSSGNLLVGKTALDNAVVGGDIRSTGNAVFVRSGGACLFVNRLVSDGIVVEIGQDTEVEGNISVSGTTVSYNGGHLSRWAQMLTKPDLLKGTVMSNLDEMNVYIAPTTYWTEEDELPVDEEGNPTVAVGDVKVETHEVQNEQLNKVKVSDVEGDANVAGVFVNWDYDEAHQVDEINMAMTGDMIVRIAQGTTVARGDLLMSAGDGTAKPQGDDIVRSKTIAKVTSTHVTCTYDDGSYCVPCVLMAC